MEIIPYTNVRILYMLVHKTFSSIFGRVYVTLASTYKTVNYRYCICLEILVTGNKGSFWYFKGGFPITFSTTHFPRSKWRFWCHKEWL